jgi:Transglycosylase SLT domain/SPOR domain
LRPDSEKRKSNAIVAHRAKVATLVSAWTGTAADEMRARRSRRVPAFIVAAFAAWSTAPAFADSAPATDNALATLCGIVETSAKEEGLPINFFTRLIWRESSFRPGAVSPAGAQGVAQFMPGTANDRGLADPFDPATAIPASAKLIAELAQRFGNLGLAAAAYNAGSHALANWLAGHADLPMETQDYVLAITGHDVGEWRGADPPSAAAPDPDQPCLASIAKLRVARGPDASLAVSGLFAPWGVQISASFDKSSALRAFARAQRDYSSVIGGITPFVLGTVLRSRGWRPFYRVRLPAQTGAEAKKLCYRLQAVGGACAVLRS